jgi:hypothetical protein
LFGVLKSAQLKWKVYGRDKQLVILPVTDERRNDSGRLYDPQIQGWDKDERPLRQASPPRLGSKGRLI